MGMRVLTEAGVENARADVEWLIASCLETRRMQSYLNLNRDLDEMQQRHFESSLRRRAAREPLQHILGTAEFFGRSFEVNRFVLIPRPETELLADLGVRHLRQQPEPSQRPVGEVRHSGSPLLALDFGTGSGCLAVTLALEIGGREHVHTADEIRGREPPMWEGRCGLTEPPKPTSSRSPDCWVPTPSSASRFTERREVEITAIDISLDAIEVARRNARRHGCEGAVRFFQGDGFAALRSVVPSAMERFDLILTNPPYIPWGEILGLQPEVRDYDPVLALDGGEDGLDFYRRLAVEASVWMRETGVLMAEFGDGQFEKIAGLFRDAGWVVEEPIRDDSGRLRILIARPAAS